LVALNLSANFQISWARQLYHGSASSSSSAPSSPWPSPSPPVSAAGAITSAAGAYEILTIAEMTHISDPRFIIASTAVNNVSSITLFLAFTLLQQILLACIKLGPFPFATITLKIHPVETAQVINRVEKRNSIRSACKSSFERQVVPFSVELQLHPHSCPAISNFSPSVKLLNSAV
jgi:hypothetical protein